MPNMPSPSSDRPKPSLVCVNGTVVGDRAPIGSAYYDPAGVARWLLHLGEPLPVDLEADLEAMGYLLEEFKLSVQADKYNVGFYVE
jgi:hypothetical protein